MSAAVCTTDPNTLSDLVNKLTSELAQVRRSLAAASRKASAATRTLEGRTQELAEARAALALLIATLDTTTDGLLAMGHFGRAMHYNTRFVEMWRIEPDRLPTLSDSALLALQLAQVSDPQAYLAHVEACKAAPDAHHAFRVALADGRVLACTVVPHRVSGKRIGTVTSWRDVTASPTLGA